MHRSWAATARFLSHPVTFSTFSLALLTLLSLPCSSCFAQTDQTRENLLLSASKAATWSEGPANVAHLDGNVTIDLDQAHMTADGAVVWLTPVRGAVLDEQRAEIALIGNANLSQPDGINRSGQTLFVTAIVRGTVRITADMRESRNLSDSDIYKSAAAIRPVEAPPTTQLSGDSWLIQRPWMLPGPTTLPAAASQPAVQSTLVFAADASEGAMTRDQLVAIVLTGNVKLFQRRPDGEFLELQCERAVLFTPLHSLKEIEKSDRFKSIDDAVTSAYLEGDVRMVHTPPPKHGNEQRLTGNRVYYDFKTDRAILTQAVVHTLDTKSNTPMIVRADTVRQLSEGEFTAEHAQLTSSSFATPSYSIGLNKVYIREIDTGDPRYGTYTQFQGTGATFNVFNTPFFYLPVIAGTMTERGAIFRDFEVLSGARFGPSLITRWGLFETFGKIPPPNTDFTYQIDYFGKRGPAVGLDGKYQGGLSTEMTKEPWAFSGDFNAFFVDDHGKDDLGRRRLDVEPPTSTRGRIDFHHQYFLPDDWQLQLSVGYSSDPTFLEEWFRTDYFLRPPQETALYLKHQRDTEAVTFLLSGQINNFVTSFDYAQEQAEVQRVPEIGYRRIGDSLGGDSLTFFSENTFSGLEFRRSRATLTEQGYAPGESPGLPSFGTTGEPGNVVYRGDFRQELDYPFSAGQFRVVPYVLGRYTEYSDSPDGAMKNRLLVGAGVRFTTAFWKVDDTVASTLLDLHRLRHVIEPEVNLFTSAENVHRDRLFQFDEQVDDVTDVTGAQIALRQRWQTKRGDAGRWRSVDFLSLNVEGNFYTHKPNDVLLDPVKFRGLYFESMPEASIPRNSINADATWRVSDTTALLSDAQYNLDKSTLATASIGVAVQRGERLTYFLGQRYIEALNSNITSLAVSYELTSKYTIAFRQSFDFGQNHNVTSDLTFLRHFDRFFAALTLKYDVVGGDSGFLINIYPEGLGRAAGQGAAGLSSAVGR